MVNICLDELSSKGKVCLGNPFGGFGLKVKKNNYLRQHAVLRQQSEPDSPCSGFLSRGGRSEIGTDYFKTAYLSGI